MARQAERQQVSCSMKKDDRTAEVTAGEVYRVQNPGEHSTSAGLTQHRQQSDVPPNPGTFSTGEMAPRG